jgi:diguanylate cyclase
VLALLAFVRDFSMDLKEIRSSDFKDDMVELSSKFASEAKLKKIRSHFEREKDYIADYIELHKKYLTDREGGLKDIIEILTTAMVTLDTENQQYNQKILQQSEKIEQITFLGDIKKVKQALIEEIEQIRETVKEKQNRDSVKLDSLSKQVSTLNMQLEKVRAESLTDGLTGVYNRKAFDDRIGDTQS